MELSPAELKALVHEALDERDSMDHETHSDHHRFINSLIEKQKKKDERWEAVRRQAMGWGAIAFLSGAGTAAYQWVMHVFSKGTPH